MPRQEEEIGLPLLRAYFAPEEVAPKTQEIINQTAPHILGGFFYHLDAEGGSKGAINQFMAQEGIPFFVYYIAFSPMRQKYFDTTQVHIDADFVQKTLRGASPARPGRAQCFRSFQGVFMSECLRFFRVLCVC